MDGLNSFFYGTGGLVVFIVLIALGLLFLLLEGFSFTNGFILFCGVVGIADWVRKKKLG